MTLADRIEGLEAAVDRMAQLGQVRLSKTERGYWHACLELPAPKGTKAQVRSDFDHETHLKAMQCLERRVADIRGQLTPAAALRAREQGEG